MATVTKSSLKVVQNADVSNPFSSSGSNTSIFTTTATQYAVLTIIGTRPFQIASETFTGPFSNLYVPPGVNVTINTSGSGTTLAMWVVFENS